MNPVNPVLIAIPVLTALALLAWGGRRRMKREAATKTAHEARLAQLEAAREIPLPDRAAEIRFQTAAATNTPMMAGKVMLVLSGTFSAKLGARLLKMMAQCGIDQAVGSILLIELDEWRRHEFLSELPEVFRDRLVMASCAALPGGGRNAPLEEIEQLRRYWMPEITRRAHEVCDLHQRRDPRSNEAAQIIPFVSLGTTGYIGATAIEHIKRRFRAAQCVGFTAYPHHDRLRSRAPAILAAYTQAGCHGFIAADNLPDETAPERDFLVNDMGMVAIIVGLISATRNADAVTETNNAFTLVLPEAPGGIASFRTYMTTVPGYVHQPHPELEPRYYVIGDATVAACLNALDEVGEDHRKAVGAEYGRIPHTSRFDILLVPLEPASLLTIQDEVRTALQTVAPLPANYDLFLSGIKTVIDPDRPTCPIVAVSIEALTDPKQHLETVSQPLLAARSTTPIPLMGTSAPSANGVAPIHEEGLFTEEVPHAATDGA